MQSDKKNHFDGYKWHATTITIMAATRVTIQKLIGYTKFHVGYVVVYIIHCRTFPGGLVSTMTNSNAGGYMQWQMTRELTHQFEYSSNLVK